jgi:hypothetical protein
MGDCLVDNFWVYLFLFYPRSRWFGMTSSWKHWLITCNAIFVKNTWGLTHTNIQNIARTFGFLCCSCVMTVKDGCFFQEIALQEERFLLSGRRIRVITYCSVDTAVNLNVPSLKNNAYPKLEGGEDIFQCENECDGYFERQPSLWDFKLKTRTIRSSVFTHRFWFCRFIHSGWEEQASQRSWCTGEDRNSSLLSQALDVAYNRDDGCEALRCCARSRIDIQPNVV